MVLQGADNHVSTATLQTDGSFAIADPPLGKVAVAVTNYPRGSASPDSTPPLELPGLAECKVPPRVAVRLPERFAQPERSGVVVEIQPGQRHLVVSLPKRDADPPSVRRPVSVVGPEIGNVAPDINGDDLDGRLLTLKEHRGKVVALVFWAHWCNLCRAEFPRYHALVERMKDEPFVLLGVNCDPERDLIERENAPRGINWRSWWDGVAFGGPVTRAWQLEGLPAVILIDREGVVRHRNLTGDGLERAVEKMTRLAPESVTLK